MQAGIAAWAGNCCVQMTINRATSSYQPRLKNPSISARCVAQKLAEALMLSVCYLLRSRAAAGHIKEQRLPGPLRMIVGTGIDIAEVDRVAASIERFGKRFLERVFTPAEIRYCESKANKAERYAGRFAAKEAAMKAIGTGWSRGVHGRFFGGEASGVALCFVRFRLAVPDFCRSENALQKPLPEALDGRRDAIHLRNVNAGSNDHP